MNLKQILREKLEAKEKETNKPSRKNPYGCVMLYLDVNEKEWKALQSKIDEDDIYKGPDGEGFAREYDPHVTILYGIHADVPDSDVEDLIDGITEPDIEMKKISSFTNKEFDVLKFDVKSKDLVKQNKDFKALPHTNDFPDYHPHVTIAYLKKDKVEKYVTELKDIEPIEVKVEKIVYSKPDDSKKNFKVK